MASSDKNGFVLDTAHVIFLRYRIKQSGPVPLSK